MPPKRDEQTVIQEALQRSPHLTLGESGTAAPHTMNEATIMEQARRLAGQKAVGFFSATKFSFMVVAAAQDFASVMLRFSERDDVIPGVAHWNGIAANHSLTSVMQTYGPITRLVHATVFMKEFYENNNQPAINPPPPAQEGPLYMRELGDESNSSQLNSFTTFDDPSTWSMATASHQAAADHYFMNLVTRLQMLKCDRFHLQLANMAVQSLSALFASVVAGEVDARSFSFQRSVQLLFGQLDCLYASRTSSGLAVAHLATAYAEGPIAEYRRQAQMTAANQAKFDLATKQHQGQHQHNNSSGRGRGRGNQNTGRGGTKGEKNA